MYHLIWSFVLYNEAKTPYSVVVPGAVDGALGRPPVVSASGSNPAFLASAGTQCSVVHVHYFPVLASPSGTQSTVPGGKSSKWLSLRNNKVFIETLQAIAE